MLRLSLLIKKLIQIVKDNFYFIVINEWFKAQRMLLLIVN